MPSPDQSNNRTADDGDVKGADEDLSAIPSHRADFHDEEYSGLDALQRTDGEDTVPRVSAIEREGVLGFSGHENMPGLAPNAPGMSDASNLFFMPLPDPARMTGDTPDPALTSSTNADRDCYSTDGLPKAPPPDMPNVFVASLAGCEDAAYRHSAAAANTDIQIRQHYQTDCVQSTVPTAEFPLTPFLEDAEEIDWAGIIEDFDWTKCTEEFDWDQIVGN